MTSPEVPASVPFPASHLDLLERGAWGVLTTMSTGGRPRSRLVPVGHDGVHATVTTTLRDEEVGRLLVDPRVSLLVLDPASTTRFVQVRGDAQLVADPPGHPPDGGAVVWRIHARRITLDAIHS